ncbi:DNA adenine methylase [Klebsiella michiganensis]|uniref:DNA adenine methylase n=1 Tax=Klebsiella michiganensis TaxID=1134687 RepID=A0A7H4N337_9ENTR|nr:DNA adenine methylase [Klebsiella michiganensis]
MFDKTWRGEKFSYINRTELEAKGQAFMALVQFAAEQPKIKNEVNK